MEPYTITYNNTRYYVIQIEGKKHYFPSVTSIIGYSSDHSGIDKWKERIGEEEAARQSKFATHRGEVMHLLCEEYCKNLKIISDNGERYKATVQKMKGIILDGVRDEYSGYKIGDDFTKEEFKSGLLLFSNFYLNKCFDKVKDIIMQEGTLYSKLGGGYAGRTDKIYLNTNDEIIIADYKNSKKPKRDEWLDGYKCQIAAYYVPYWEIYKKKPTGGEIWISNDYDNIPQIFYLNEFDMKIYYKKFLEMVKKFHNDHPIPENPEDI